MDPLASRTAARYIQARDEAALEALADHWADVFLDELAKSVDITEDAVEQVLRSKGVTADDVNSLVGEKSAGFGNLVKALGGWIAGHIWHMLVAPFIGIGRLVVSSKFRTDVKRSFIRALKHEVRATRHLVRVAGRLARGEEVNPREKKAAMHQLMDVLLKVVLVYFAGPHVAHLFQHGVWKALAALLSPLDEVLAILLDKPIRAVAKKLMNADIGLLPSGFYTHFRNAALGVYPKYADSP